MEKDTFTIAEARNQLPRLIHRAESHSPITLTRRGKPVAVLMAYEEYEQSQSTSFSEACARFRKEYSEILGELTDAFENLREHSAGREVDL